MSIQEMYGLLAEQHQQECEKHVQTVGVLRALKNGDLTLDMVTVNDDNSWGFDTNVGRIPVSVKIVDPPDDDAAVS